jgi:hypothetical protein
MAPRDLVSVAKTLSWAISDTGYRMKAEFATDNFAPYGMLGI